MKILRSLIVYAVAVLLPLAAFGQNQLVGNLTFTTSLRAGITTPATITGTSGALTLTGAGTNQSITLTPSGTGAIVGQFGAIKLTIDEDVVAADHLGLWLLPTATAPTSSNYTLSSNGVDTTSLNSRSGGVVDIGVAGTAGLRVTASDAWARGTLTFGSAADAIWSRAAGGATLTMSGTNQNITLTPSGTGRVDASNELRSTGGIVNSHGASGVFRINANDVLSLVSGSLRLNSSGTGSFVAVQSGNLLLGGLVIDGTGVLQFPTATTSAGGITMGTDTNWFRSSAGVWSTGSSQIINIPGASGSYRLNGGDVISLVSSVLTFNSGGVASIGLNTNGATALTIDSSQSANHAKGIGFGVTSTATAAGTTVLAATSTVVQIFTGSTTQNVTLPAANLRGAAMGVTFIIKNRSSGTVTINRAGADLIDGATSYALLAGTSIMLISDGVSEFTLN